MDFVHIPIYYGFVIVVFEREQKRSQRPQTKETSSNGIGRGERLQINRDEN